MAERRKGKKKKDLDSKDLDKKPTKEEYAIARYLKQKLPEKKTTLLGHKVEYFIASKAIDCLLESPWAKKTKKDEIYFNNRDAVISYMARMLEQKLFHRAKKIVIQKDPKKKKNEEEIDSVKEKETKKSKGKSETTEKKDEKEGKKEGETGEKKKEKKKIKLDMHLEQIFIDSNEPYVWIYDPIPIRTWITGALMVVAAVLICLFPLWPQTIRHYIYYLSVAAAFFLVFIIGLAVFRLVFFVLVWVLTFGRHHIWLLPNLTEDVGFFESFWPLYKYEYRGSVKKEEKDSDKESKDKDKDDSKKDDSSQEKEAEKSDASSTDQERKVDQNNSESEESDDKQKENENGFEMIDAEDANDSKSEEEDRKTK